MTSTLHVFTIALLFTANILSAQQTLHEISMKPGYSDEVYVSLAQGKVKSASLTEWDLGFEIKGFSSSIIVNEGKGWELYYIPESTESTFSQSLQESDISQWERVINSPRSWSSGAFNRGVDAALGTYGWGEYNPATHTVTGSAVYVMKLADKMMKKVFITGLAGGTYTFKYANLDGTDEKTGAVAKSDFEGRNFGYYSFSTQDVVDHEPETQQWDMVFGKYVDYAPDQSGNEIPYPVAGIRTNMGITVAKVPNGASGTVVPDESAFSNHINTIGFSWKTFTGSGWSIDTSTAYYVKNQQNTIYKIVFKNFGGMSTGTTVFTQEEIVASNINDYVTEDNTMYSVFPTTLISASPLNIHSHYQMTGVSLLDYTGKIVWTNKFTAPESMVSISVPSLPTGQYALLIHGGTVPVMKKICIYQ